MWLSGDHAFLCLNIHLNMVLLFFAGWLSVLLDCWSLNIMQLIRTTNLKTSPFVLLLLFVDFYAISMQCWIIKSFGICGGNLRELYKRCRVVTRQRYCALDRINSPWCCYAVAGSSDVVWLRLDYLCGGLRALLPWGRRGSSGSVAGTSMERQTSVLHWSVHQDSRGVSTTKLLQRII